MAAKLKHLKVKKVDFVDEGANPEAHIRLFKRKDEAAEDPETKSKGVFRKMLSLFSDLLELDEKITSDDIKKAEESTKQDTAGDCANDKESNAENNQTKGEETDMKFDKSKMTPEELATLEDFEKRFGVAKSDDEAAETTCEEDTATDVSLDEKAETNVDEDKGVDVDKKAYASLHPDVAAEIEELKKFKEAAEDKELLDVAKKYEILGKKPEELVKKLKSLKKAGGTAYDDMISVLDESVVFAQKSGLFNEVGKSGHGASAGSAEATARARAVELMKSKTELTMSQAIDEVLQADPELRKRYEEED